MPEDDAVTPQPATRAPDHRWEWLTQTAPFSALDVPDQPASFVVEQISDRDFRIPGHLGFQYNPDTGGPIRVTATSLPKTDFASIPRYMSWFVSRQGRHTPAALVHDQLVAPGISFEDRKEADTTFLRMLDDLEVPPVQGRVMWAAVTLATRWSGPAPAKIGLILWGILAAIGIGLLGAGIATSTPWMIVVALIGPALASLLWGDQSSAGLIAGYSLPIVVVPALTSFLGYLVYWLIEQLVKVIRKLFSHNRGQDLPEPMGYQGR